MQKPKNILIVAPYAFGYTDHICTALNEKDGVNASIMYLDKPDFQYKNKLHKFKNFFSKLFLRRNLKKTFVNRRICSEVKNLGNQDIIFIIRPDILSRKTLRFLKKRAKKFIAYYYDSTRRFPRKVTIASVFDTVYSYDTLDVEKYKYKFLSNYIFEETQNNNYDYLFFNISTNDYRFPILEKLAGYLSAKMWSYKILVYNGDDMLSRYVTVITKQKSLDEASYLLSKCKIIVEIQRTEQVGLSFRVFEALGHRKKLITTNKDIINYDFYNPQNILVIDENNIQIPEEFVTSDYVEVDEKILNKYRIENWVKPIFDL